MSPASLSILGSLLAPVDRGRDDDDDYDSCSMVHEDGDDDGDNDDYDIVKTHLLNLPEVQSCSTRAGS